MTVEEIERVIKAYFKTNASYRQYGEGKAYELIHADMRQYYENILMQYNFLLEEEQENTDNTNKNC